MEQDGLRTAPAGKEEPGKLKIGGEGEGGGGRGGCEACNPGHPLLPLQVRTEKNSQVGESSSS